MADIETLMAQNIEALQHMETHLKRVDEANRENGEALKRLAERIETGVPSSSPVGVTTKVEEKNVYERAADQVKEWTWKDTLKFGGTALVGAAVGAGGATVIVNRRHRKRLEAVAAEAAAATAAKK